MILDDEENEKDSDFLSTIKAGTYIPFSSYSGCWIVSCQQMLSKIYQYLESSKKTYSLLLFYSDNKRFGDSCGIYKWQHCRKSI